MRTVLLFLAVGFLSTDVARAWDWPLVPACGDQKQDCCSRCGVKKVCKVVCEMKEVKKTCWEVECEEFCVPLPGLGKSRCADQGCCEVTGCGDECSDGCENDVCQSLRERPMVPPKCGEVRCRKKLVKKETTCEVPVYKCVLVPACGCGSGGCTDTGCGVTPEETAWEKGPRAFGLVKPLPALFDTLYLKSLWGTP